MFRRAGSVFDLTPNTHKEIHDKLALLETHKESADDDAGAKGGSGLREKLRKVLKIGIKDAVKAQRGQFFTQFEPSKPVAAKKYMYNVKTHKFETEDMVITLDMHSFAQGALRECFKLVEVDVQEQVARLDHSWRLHHDTTPQELERTRTEIVEAMTEQMTPTHKPQADPEVPEFFPQLDTGDSTWKAQTADGIVTLDFQGSSIEAGKKFGIKIKGAAATIEFTSEEDAVISTRCGKKYTCTKAPPPLIRKKTRTKTHQWKMKETDRKPWVAKRSMKGHLDIEQHKADCLADAALQQVAKHYGEEFVKAARLARNKKGSSGAMLHDVDFLMAHVIELEDGSTFGVEAFIFGDYAKFNNNSGIVFNPRCHITPQAFSYFTFVNSCKSGNPLMIVDIQGVGDIFTDPVLHFLPQYHESLMALGDQAVNLGLRGFALFLWSHRYNPGDSALGLETFAHALSEQRSVGGVAALGMAELASVIRSHEVSRPTEQEYDGEKIDIENIPGLDLRPSTWAKVNVPENYGEAGKVLPPSLVVAACHMEIAMMYNDGRLCADPQKGTSEPEAEAAVFHLWCAAKEGLPEAMLAFARLVSDLPHDTFLPAVKPQREHEELCLVLLRGVAAGGARCGWAASAALGALAARTENPKQAAPLYEQFAELSAAIGEEKKSDDENSEAPVDGMTRGLHVSSAHRECFGWENHGLEPHTAYAKAAEYYSQKTGLTSKKKAAELFASAAELAAENPLFAKASMLYSMKAEELEAEIEELDEQTEEMNRQVSAESTAPVTQLLLENIPQEAHDAFLEYALGFASPSEAFAQLVKLHCSR